MICYNFGFPNLVGRLDFEKRRLPAFYRLVGDNVISQRPCSAMSRSINFVSHMYAFRSEFHLVDHSDRNLFLRTFKSPDKFLTKSS